MVPHSYRSNLTGPGLYLLIFHYPHPRSTICRFQETIYEVGNFPSLENVYKIFLLRISWLPTVTISMHLFFLAQLLPLLKLSGWCKVQYRAYNVQAYTKRKQQNLVPSTNTCPLIYNEKMLELQEKSTFCFHRLHIIQIQL